MTTLAQQNLTTPTPTIMASAAPKLTLRQATPADIPRLMEIADNAFGTDSPINRGIWPERLTPDPVRRHEAAQAWYTASAERDMAEDKDRLWLCVEVEEEGGPPGGEIAGCESPCHSLRLDERGHAN